MATSELLVKMATHMTDVHREKDELSDWALIGVALSLVATLYSGFAQDFGFSTFSTALNAPIGLQEMVLAEWLIAKGFNQEPKRPTAESRA